MKQDLRNLLEESVRRIDSGLATEENLRRLCVLFDQITLFNPTYKLVSASDRELVSRHIADSLAPALIIRGFLKENDRVADLGSGSGLPGFVLASSLTDLQFSLVDRMGRRIGFLRNTLALAGLSSKVNVIQSDLGELTEVFDAVVFRAFRQMGDIIDDLARITHEGSYVFAYKSSEDNIAKESEIAISSGLFDAQVIGYEVPFLDARRSLLVLRRK